MLTVLAGENLLLVSLNARYGPNAPLTISVFIFLFDNVSESSSLSSILL
jgi:hypothetical protein